MSAKRAAEAFYEYDITMREEVDQAFDGQAELAEQTAIDLIKSARATWTLTLAAHAAGVNEDQVLIQFAKNHLKIPRAKAIELVDCSNNS